MLKPGETDRVALSHWASELADAMAKAVNEVQRSYGATSEDMAWELIWMGAEHFQYNGVTRSKSVELLLERAADVIAEILYETYYTQDEGKPPQLSLTLTVCARQLVSFTTKPSTWYSRAWLVHDGLLTPSNMYKYRPKGPTLCLADSQQTVGYVMKIPPIPVISGVPNDEKE